MCGFLNAEGGNLLIGVSDEGSTIGLTNDLKTLGSKANLDGYELVLREQLDNSLSMQTVGVVQIRFESVNGVEVCVVAVAASGRRVFAKPHEGGQVPTEFWVRIGMPRSSFTATIWWNTRLTIGLMVLGPADEALAEATGEITGRPTRDKN